MSVTNANQQAYLSQKLAEAQASGNKGLENWVNNQAKTLGVNIAPNANAGKEYYFDKNFGGLDNYTANQQQRYNQAVTSGDTDLINRLNTDSQRVGYSLSQPTQPTQPTQQPSFTPTQNHTQAYEPTQNYNRDPLEYLLELIAYGGQKQLDNPMGYDEAKRQASEKYNPLYDEALEKTLKSIETNALHRGFFGQLPTMDYQQREGDNIERARAGAISDLAQALISQSKQDAMDRYNVGRNERQDQLNNLLSILGYKDNKSNSEWERAFRERAYQDGRTDIDWEKMFKERGYTDSRGDIDFNKLFQILQYGDTRSDIDWEKGFKEKQYEDTRDDINWQRKITEAGLTGYFNQIPTLAYTQMMHNMGLQNKQMALQEKQVNSSIDQAWKRIANDNTQIQQAWARIGLDKENAQRNQQNFMVGVKSKAWELAMGELSKQGKTTIDEFGFETLDPSISEAELLPIIEWYSEYLMGNDPGQRKDYKGLYK